MNRWFILTCILVSFVVSQEMISPCPGSFQYENKTGNSIDRWYGVATLVSDTELNGVWFRIFLDRTSSQLGNWFGEVEVKDKGYLIKNPDQKMKANSPLKIRFYVRYNPGEQIPKLISMRLNERQICPIEEATTKSPQNDVHVFTNKPVPLEPTRLNNTRPYSQSLQHQHRPQYAEPDEDDFFRGDFYELFKPKDKKQNLLDTAICGTVVTQPRPLITFGQATNEGEFPWHAALYYSRGLVDLSYICGASLISSRHLITVAHCVTKIKSKTVISPDSLIVYLGKYYLRGWKNAGLQDRRINSILIHPEFVPDRFASDIAVLKMNEAVKLTNYVRPICLPDKSPLEKVLNKAGIVVGWGYDESGIVSNQLTKASMQIVSQETCIYSYPEFYAKFTNENTFCASFRNGTSACNGDSGGALVLPKAESDPNHPVWQIRGLISVSVALQDKNQCDSKQYVIFTDVGKYMDFVKQAIAL